MGDTNFTNECVNAYRKLYEAGEVEATLDRLLSALAQLEIRLRNDIYSAEHAKVLDEFFDERDNLIVALDWSLRQQPPASFQARVLQGVRLISSLAAHWHLIRDVQDGIRWVELALEQVKPPFPESVEQRAWSEARALTAIGNLMATLDNLPGVQRYLEEGIALWRELGSKQQLLNAIHRLVETVGSRGEAQWIDSLTSEALALAHELNDPLQLARTLAVLADIDGERGKFDNADSWAQEALQIFRSHNSSGMMIYTLNIRGQLAIYRNAAHEALPLLQEATAIWEASSFAKLGYHPWTTRNLGLVYQQLGRYDEALASYQQSLQGNYEQSRSAGMAWAIEGMAEVAALTNNPARAIYLWGLAARLRKEANSTLGPPDRTRYDRLLPQVRSQLDSTTFESAWKQGSVAHVSELLSHLPPSVE